MKTIKLLNLNLKSFKYTTHLYMYDKDFLLRLNEMTQNGFTLYEAMKFLFSQYEEVNHDIKVNCLEMIQQGDPLSKVLNDLKYSNDIVMQVQFAEQYGDVNMALSKCYQFLVSKSELYKHLLKTVQYPLILIIIFIALILTVNATVLPQFESMYASMNVKVGIEIKVMTFILFMLPNIIYMIITLFIIFLLYYYYMFRRLSVEYQLKIVFRLPFIKTIYRLYITYRFSEMLSFFLSNGVMMKRIIEILELQDRNKVFKYSAHQINNRLIKGSDLKEAVYQLNLYEPSIINFMAHGEKNSKLDKELKYYSEFIFRKFEMQLFKYIKTIQPVIFAVLAILIITMYLVIILPMLQMMEGIK